MSVEDCGGQIQVQVFYEDFKHIDTVRRELTQMMPEVEFVKIRRGFTHSAERMVLCRMHDEDPRHPVPTIYVKRGKTLVEASLRDIVLAELVQLELDDDDEITYTDTERNVPCDDYLSQNAYD
ncbi:hypothetical protein [Prevotella sp. OH937_COT-195]|uniref:hypothetical protein n=1 Tax=Prevotella sp. OH937_COT-195 TaxID=2491051 RepID=UPI000F64B1C5|nr:hypothetical protein [Prevotella sp. OH937_COT-195]RRD02676.1 hypothetical protein EII32_01280 [Prevotella sp. OH937_COT-195]